MNKKIFLAFSLLFITANLHAKPMWEISDKWKCNTAFLTGSDKRGYGLRRISQNNIEEIDFKTNKIKKTLPSYNRTIYGNITKKSYMENKQQRVYETHWIVFYEGVGNVSSMAVKVPNSNNYYKGKLALSTEDGNVYGNAENCYPIT